MSSLKLNNAVSAPALDTEREVALCYLQSAITMGNMGLQGVTTLGSPNTNSGPGKMKIVKVPGGIELRTAVNAAFIPDGNIKILGYK